MAQKVSAQPETKPHATVDALTAAKLRLQPLLPDMDPCDLDLDPDQSAASLWFGTSILPA